MYNLNYFYKKWDNAFLLTSLLEFLDERLDGFFRPLLLSFLFFRLLVTQQPLNDWRLWKKAGHLQVRSNTSLEFLVLLQLSIFVEIS